MKTNRFFVLFALLFLPLFLHSQEEPLFYVNDFLNQNEILVLGKEASFSCQAVRIHPNWYLTAAHCVKSICEGGACTVQINLVQGELSAQAFVAHSPAAPTVFAYEGFSLHQNRSSSFDMALIRYQPYLFQFYNHKTELEMTRKSFVQKVAQDPQASAQWSAALSPKRVRLLHFSVAESSRLARVIAVPRITENGVFFYHSAGAPVYYVKELQHLLTANFGVEKGMSGSGVLTHTGELVGVVSAAVYDANGSASFYDNQGKIMARFNHLNHYFLFAGFNGATLNFIRNTVSKFGDSMADVGLVTADEEYAETTGHNFKKITQLIDSVERTD